MSTAAISEQSSSTTDPFLRIVPPSGTRQVAINFAIAGSSTAGRPIEDAYIRAYHALVPKRTIEEEEAEEREWDSIVRKPHVQDALRRMAAEARRQYYVGETEEGGFGLE